MPKSGENDVTRYYTRTYRLYASILNLTVQRISVVRLTAPQIVMTTPLNHRGSWLRYSLVVQK